MFKCQRCKKTTAANEKSNFLVVETRKKKYYAREVSTDDEGNRIIVQGKLQGEGFETVREINVCTNCYSRENEKCLEQIQS